MPIMSGGAAGRKPSPERVADARLGRAIRALRHARGMTLAQVAAATGLSQPFLSQLELGRTRPSMRSLFRIAGALGTTQQALLGAGSPAPSHSPEPVRGRDAELIDGAARLLLHDPEGADVTEFVGAAAEFGEFFSHDRRELLYVVSGAIELELREPSGSRLVTLGTRDTISYSGRVEHRFRRCGAEPCVVLLVHSGRTDA